MDPSRLLLLLLISVMSAFECSETATPECTNIKETARERPDGEALHVMFVFQDLDQFPHEQFKWFKNKKNSTNATLISPNKTERVHYHAGELFFLNLLPEDSGSYTAQHIDESGVCYNYNVDIGVYNASDRWNDAHFYGKKKSSDDNIEIVCPDPVVETCTKFKGNYTWYKNFTYLPSISTNKKEIWVNSDSQDVQGLYTCLCTWPYNNHTYNSSASRMLEVKKKQQERCEILSPINTEQFADEGVGIRLNCSVFCGIRAEKDCGASWLLDPDMTYGYSNTNVPTDNSSKTIVTTVLIIDKVSAADFQRKFKCIGSCLFKQVPAPVLTLKQRESRTPLIVTPICVLLICVFAAVLVKCFAIDLALLFRRYIPLSSKRKDERMYDAYVVYQMQNMDKVTEDKLSRFVTQVLPAVLEDKCGYRLFIHGRDDIPGEDRVELVEDSVKQSRRLMVILTPDSGSGPEVTDKSPAYTPESAIGGFDWQVGLHHVLVQREMSVILIQIGDTGPQGYTHLPIGLQHLIRKSAPVRWPDGSRGAASWNSRFWKRVRYLMPATPAKKCSHSAIV